MLGIETLLQNCNFTKRIELQLELVFKYVYRDAYGRPSQHISFSVVQCKLVDSLFRTCVLTNFFLSFKLQRTAGIFLRIFGDFG